MEWPYKGNCYSLGSPITTVQLKIQNKSDQLFSVEIVKMMNNEISDSENDGDEDMMVDDDKNELHDDQDNSDDSQFSSWSGAQISKTSPLTNLTA